MLGHDTRVGAYGVIVRDGRILLAHFNHADTLAWTLPGGGLEVFEDPGGAALREIYEETGYRVELDGLLGIDSEHITAEQRLHGAERPLHSLRIVYRAIVVGGSLRHEQNGSTDEARWFDLEDVPELPRVRLIDAALGMWRAVKSTRGHSRT